MMGSVAEETLRRVTCPVLIVGPSVPASRSPEPNFKEIVLATNFGAESLAASAYAISLAQEFQARLTLLNVVTDQINSHIDPSNDCALVRNAEV